MSYQARHLTHDDIIDLLKERSKRAIRGEDYDKAVQLAVSISAAQGAQACYQRPYDPVLHKAGTRRW